MQQDKSLALFILLSKHRMVSHYLPKLEICLEAVSDHFLWFKEDDANSIGGMMLHLLKHIEKNTERYNHPETYFTQGIESYFPDEKMPRSEVSWIVRDTFQQWEIALENAKKLEMSSLYHLVEHTSYHLGQIVDRVQRYEKIKFQFIQQGINEHELKRRIAKDLSS